MFAFYITLLLSESNFSCKKWRRAFYHSFCKSSNIKYVHAVIPLVSSTGLYGRCENEKQGYKCKFFTSNNFKDRQNVL